MNHILLVEDDPDSQALMSGLFASATAQLHVAATLAQARKALEFQQYDLIILDLSLPDGDSFNVCREIKQAPQHFETPVIFVTGRFDIEDKITAFSLGADDYVVKPFDPRELKARILSKLTARKAQRASEDDFRKGDLRFSYTQQKVFILKENKDPGKEPQEVSLDLTALEYKLLHYFAKHVDHVLTRQQILTAIWGENVHILDRTVDTHISALRKKLEPSQCRVKSVYGSGYRFVCQRAQTLKQAA